MRLARLRREVEEVKGQFHNREEDKQKATGAGGTNDDDGATFDGMDRLRQVLEEMNRLANGSMRNAEANLAKMLSKGFEAKGSPQPTADASVPDGQSTTYTVTYAPSYQQSHALAKVADFDTRLTMLEKVLGVGSSATFNFEQATPGPILPTLDLLDKQISTLSSSTTSSLDTIGRKVRQLTQEAEKLDEARRSAKAAQDALRSNSSSPQIGNGDATPAASLDDPEYVSKVNALYGTLPTIESFAPLLPAVLDRLRSLQAIHTGAATASQSLDDVEKRQEEMAAEVKRWREGLVQLEGKMKQGEVRMGSNMKAVEGWVKELEGRVEKVSQ